MSGISPRVKKLFVLGLTVAVLLCLVVLIPVALVTQPFVSTVLSHPPPVDPARLERHVKHLSVDLYPRSYDQRRNLELAAQYIESEFTATGAAIRTQEQAVDGVIYKNIIARFGPDAGPLMVVGAHYDSYGNPNRGSRDPRGYSLASHTPGADDNASGVAGLIELARLLGATSQTRSIELVAYTLEEPPHFRTQQMGSVWHARSLATAKREVQLMLSLEMIGYFRNEPRSQHFPFPWMARLYSDRAEFVALVGNWSMFGCTRRAKALMSGATDLPVYS
ncbi:MAG: M28 family peptidase [Acidobacteriota bacterium]